MHALLPKNFAPLLSSTPATSYRKARSSSKKRDYKKYCPLDLATRGGGAWACQAVSDHQKAAEARLASLIDTAGDGEQELLDKIVAEEPGDEKFGGYLIWSFLVLGGSILICSWQQLDPYGGASFSLGSLQNGLWGVAAASPIAFYKLLMWTPQYQKDSKVTPIVELQKTWLKIVHPVFGNLSTAQAVIIILLECLTNSIFAFSLLQMSIFNLLQWREAPGLEISESTLMNVSLAMVAALAGWVNMGYRSPPLDQLDMVEEARENADRYYRFTVPGDGKDTAGEMAAAFKEACRKWYADRRVAMYIVGISSTFEAFVCGCLWRWTGDLSAAFTACLVFNAPDYYYMAKSIKDPKTWM